MEIDAIWAKLPTVYRSGFSLSLSSFKDMGQVAYSLQIMFLCLIFKLRYNETKQHTVVLNSLIYI